MITSARKNRQVNIVAFAYGAWLAGMMLIQFFMSGGVVSVSIGFALVIVPVGLHLWLLGSRPGNDTRGLFYFGLFFITIFISLFANTERFTIEATAQIVGFAALIVVGYLMAQQWEHHLIEKTFGWFALLFAGVLIIVLLDNDRLWTRLMGRLHSNLWAAVTIAAIPGALAMRNRAARVLLTIFFLYMIGFEFNARGPLLYSVATVAAFGILWTLHNPQKALRPHIQITAATMAGIAVLAVIINWDFIAQQVLFLDSVTRGINSGFTGRFDLWASLIGIAADHPFTGVGFRMHDQFVTMPGLVSAHNAYIAMLVDLGFLGLAFYLLLIGTGLWRSIAKQRRWIIASYLIGYALLGLTEARALNVGNPASALFVIALMAVLSRRVQQAQQVSTSAEKYVASHSTPLAPANTTPR